MIQITAVYWGALRTALGKDREIFSMEERATPYGLRRMVLHQRKALLPLALDLIYMVNRVQAAPNAILKDGDEVWFLPPEVQTKGHGKR
jgi:molybdopterin converting factor small subunit